MKRKFITLLITFLAALCFAAGFAACGGGENNNDGNLSVAGKTFYYDSLTASGIDDEMKRGIEEQYKNDYWQFNADGTLINAIFKELSDEFGLNHEYTWTQKGDEVTVSVSVNSVTQSSAVLKVTQTTLSANSVYGNINITIIYKTDKTPAAGHTHNWSQSWSNNDTHHWHECTASGCTVTDNSLKDGYAGHDFSNGDCICGKEKPTASHSHVWSGNWSGNDTHHWHECTASGCTVTDNSLKNGYAGHNFSNGDCICGIKESLVEPTTFTVTLLTDTPEACIISGSGVYEEGETATIKVRRAKPDYHFKGWFDGENEVSRDWEYSFEVENDVTYTAKWSHCPVTISGLDEAAGSAWYNYRGSDTVVVDLRSTLNSGYAILGYYFYYDTDSENQEFRSGGLNYHSFTLTKPLNILVVCDTQENIDKYIFSSTFDGLILSGVNDKTVTEITVPDYVRTIEGGAFSGCTELKTIILSETITNISANSFDGCTNLKNIVFEGTDAQWQKIVNECNLASVLADINIYHSKDEIWEPALTYSPIVENGNTVAYEVTGKGTYDEDELIIPSEYNGKPVTKIAPFAFTETNFTSVTVPDSVTSIGANSFMNCRAIVELNLSKGLKNIENESFLRCAGLKKISFPDSLENIGERSFAYCNLLNNVKFNNGLQRIGTAAFSGCALTSVTLPDSLTETGKYIFGDCPLETATVPAVACKGMENNKLKTLNITCGVITGYNSFTNFTSLENVTIYDGVTEIGEQAFCDCKMLTNITIPDSVVSIGRYAFERCPNLNYYTENGAKYLGNSGNPYLLLMEVADKEISAFSFNPKTKIIYDRVFGFVLSLESINLPEGLTHIGEQAFYQCVLIKEVNIPESVVSIGFNAFGGIWGLESFSVAQGNKNYKSVDGNLYSKDGKTLVKYAVGKSATEFTVPDGVTKILSNAFDGASRLVEVTIPFGVTIIEEETFRSCSSLERITIPDSVTKIENAAFMDCISLKSITIPDSVTFISGSAFYECDNLIQTENGVQYVDKWVVGCDASLTQVTLRSDTKGIAGFAFNGCASLVSIVIPDGTVGISDGAFNNCISLESISLPDSLLIIGDSAFQNCTSLKSITIPDSVISIGVQAFWGCSSLTSVTIGNSVTTIGNYAFWDCSSLTGVTIGNSVTAIGDFVFGRCSLLTDIIYNGTIEQWKNIDKALYWDGDMIYYYTVHCTDGDLSKN